MLNVLSLSPDFFQCCFDSCFLARDDPPAPEVVDHATNCERSPTEENERHTGPGDSVDKLVVCEDGNEGNRSKGEERVGGGYLLHDVTARLRWLCCAVGSEVAMNAGTVP